jgi:hypothetical protein
VAGFQGPGGVLPGRRDSSGWSAGCIVLQAGSARRTAAGARIADLAGWHQTGWQAAGRARPGGPGPAAPGPSPVGSVTGITAWKRTARSLFVSAPVWARAAGKRLTDCPGGRSKDQFGHNLGAGRFLPGEAPSDAPRTTETPSVPPRHARPAPDNSATDHPVRRNMGRPRWRPGCHPYRRFAQVKAITTWSLSVSGWLSGRRSRQCAARAARGGERQPRCGRAAMLVRFR